MSPGVAGTSVELDAAGRVGHLVATGGTPPDTPNLATVKLVCQVHYWVAMGLLWPRGKGQFNLLSRGGHLLPTKHAFWTLESR